MAEIALGSGCVLIQNVERDGRQGILLEQTCEPHDIDSIPLNPTPPGTPYEPKKDDVVIWLDSLESARVLQDRVNMMCLILNDFEVIDRSGNKVGE